MWMLLVREYDSYLECDGLDAEFFATYPEAEERAVNRPGFPHPSCKIFEVNVGDWIDIYPLDR